MLPDVHLAPTPGPAVAATEAGQVMLWRELKTAASEVFQKLEPFRGFGADVVLRNGCCQELFVDHRLDDVVDGVDGVEKRRSSLFDPDFLRKGIKSVNLSPY